MGQLVKCFAGWPIPLFYGEKMTEAQLVGLTAALRAQNIDHQVEKLGADSYRVRAISGTFYTADQLNNFENTHGVTARTNRAIFE